jgi:hypothetical protein
MLPRDFTPDVIDEATNPIPSEMPAAPPKEIPVPKGPQSPATAYPVHPEPEPAPAPPDSNPNPPRDSPEPRVRAQRGR